MGGGPLSTKNPESPESGNMRQEPPPHLEGGEFCSHLDLVEGPSSPLASIRTRLFFPWSEMESITGTMFQMEEIRLRAILADWEP